MQNLGYATKIVNTCNRKFIIHVLKLNNGCFVVVSENSQQIGSMLASISTTIPTTITIIPSRDNSSFFSQLLVKQVSSAINGICISSVYLLKNVDVKIIKILMTDIIKLIKND